MGYFKSHLYDITGDEGTYVLTHDTDAYNEMKNPHLFSARCPQAKSIKMFICTTHRLSHLYPPRGLRPRGDEPDQSDQSTEITVIPEVRRRAPGHSEFTHPTQAPDKSVQEWQTFGLKKLRILSKESIFRLYSRNYLNIVWSWNTASD